MCQVCGNVRHVLIYLLRGKGGVIVGLVHVGGKMTAGLETGQSLHNTWFGDEVHTIVMLTAHE